MSNSKEEINIKEKKQKETINDITLWILLDKARFAIARLRGMELAQFNITLEQSSILRTLFENNGSLTTKELEETTMRQPNSISILINRMTKLGLVKREKSSSGKRYRILLTQEGEDLIKRITLVSIEMVFSSLNPKQKKELSVYLNLLLENARHLLGIPHRPPFIKYLIDNKYKENIV